MSAAGGSGIIYSNIPTKPNHEVAMRLGPLGLTELLIILAVLLLIFGATRLPEIGSSLGKGIRMFKTSVTGEDEPAKPPEKQETAKARSNTDDLA